MADTCIVCLGDLCIRRSASPPIKDEHGTLDHQVPSADLASKATVNTPPEVSEDEYIAHILPCGHNLHDSCLRPWVERANSCPICRATFNMVELRHTLHGPTVSSYPVQDKTQKAEVEAPILAEDGGDDSDLESIQPCMVCETFGDESQLLLCDGCNQSCHVFCAGLDGIPSGSWFCYDCQSDPELWCQSERRTARRANEQRARGTQRQTRRANGLTTWARLWRSVATRTNIDLDFPFGEEEQDDGHATQPNRREFRDWQRRFQVAARAAGPGAANRFREIAAASSEQPAAESQEEIKAWNAYEKARIILEDNEPRGRRKRKSRSATPSDERPPEPERKRKRPRTIRVQDGETSTDMPVPTIAESSRAPLRNASIAAPQPRVDTTDSNGGPTFLQSLLEEVEANPSATRRTELYYDVNGEYFPFGSERSASPECSLPNSGQGTPRSMTPPPLRPVSPTVPTSHIAPIFPPPPDFAQHSTSLSDSIERARSRQRAHLSMRSPDSSPTRVSDLAVPSSPSSTPTTPNPAPNHKLGAQAKGEVQSLVKKALKPPYRAKVIDAKQFTEINKTICHRLYEEIGSEDNLADKEKWQQMASDRVLEALAKLKSDPSDRADKENEAILPIREST